MVLKSRVKRGHPPPGRPPLAGAAAHTEREVGQNKNSNLPFGPTRLNTSFLGGKGRSGDAGRKTHGPFRKLTDFAHQALASNPEFLFLFLDSLNQKCVQRSSGFK